MTPQAQQIVLLKYLGWTNRLTSSPYGEFQHTWWKSPEGKEPTTPPDFGNDLNACHEVEDTLTDQEQKRYLIYLLGDTLGSLHPHMWKIRHASAAYCLEALVRALGLWDDSK